MNAYSEKDIFDAYYFSHGCEAPYERSDDLLAFFDRIAGRIVEDIQPESVLDAGCAMGFLVESLRKRGVQAYGVDISEYAVQNALPEVKPYCWVGSIADPFPQKYDLIVSIEVLEHMQKTQSERAIANFCSSCDDVLFSSSPSDYKEVTHFNVQQPEYWGEAFARQGFFRDVDFDASFITPWAVRFTRADRPMHRIVRAYERRYWALWKENVDLRAVNLAMRDQLAKAKKKLPSGQHPHISEDAGAWESQQGAAMKVVRRLWAFRLIVAPKGSRRERLLNRVKTALRL
jgi:SAM-dependent methyltransferase